MPAASEPVQTTVDVRDLSALTREQTAKIFDGIGPPAPGELIGALRGRLTATALGDRLPPRTRRFLHRRVLQARFPWFGKAFDGDTGANVVLTSTGRFRILPYDISIGGLADGGDGGCLVLDYDRSGNVGPVRRMRGEVRTLGPGLHLARMLRRTADGYRTVLWFTLAA